MIWEQNTKQLQDRTRSITFKFTAHKTKYSLTAKVPQLVSREPADFKIDNTIDLQTLTGL